MEKLHYKEKKGLILNNLLLMYCFHCAMFSTFSFCSIIGLYVSLVLVLGRFIRVTFFTGSSYRIMFEELPVVDKVLQLCLDIYMVRENRDFLLEEDLFSKLIFLYRSPETLLRWTKLKQR